MYIYVSAGICVASESGVPPSSSSTHGVSYLLEGIGKWFVPGIFKFGPGEGGTLSSRGCSGLNNGGCE